MNHFQRHLAVADESRSHSKGTQIKTTNRFQWHAPADESRSRSRDTQIKINHFQWHVASDEKRSRSKGM